MKQIMTRKIAGFSIYELAILLFLALLAIIIGSPLDYQITSSLANPGNVFGLIIGLTGSLPMFVLAGLSGTLFFLFLKDGKYKVWAYIIGILFPLISGAVYGYEAISDYMSNLVLSCLIGAIVVFVLDFALYFLVKNAPKEEAKREGIIFLVSAIVVVAVCFVVKRLWDRPRYALLLAEPINGDVSYFFCSWWDPLKGSRVANIFADSDYPSSYFRSAPSGHCAFAACALISLTYFPRLNKKLENKRPYFFYGSLLFILLVGFGRLSDGSHFLTDVGFGWLFGFVLSFISVLVIDRKKKEIVSETAPAKTE